MKKLLLILTLALCSLPSFGFWIVGTNSDVLGYPYGTKVIFHPLTGPLSENNRIILDIQRTTALDTNGGFRCWLAGGYYNMDFGPAASQIEIAGPANNTNTFTAIQCAQAVTNLFTFGFDPGIIEMLVMSNIPPQNLRYTNPPAPGDVAVVDVTGTNWAYIPLSAGSATNAIATVSSNGIPIGTSVTNINFYSGTNTTLAFTNRNGLVDVLVSSTGGTASAYTNPQTLYVRTNGNNATAVRGDPSMAWSSLSTATASANPGDTIEILGGMFSPGTNYLTNLVIHGNGSLLVVSNQVGNMPAIITSNSVLKDLWITNASDKDTEVLLGIAYVGLQPTNTGPIFIRNCRFQSPSITAKFPFSTLPPGPNTIDIRNSIFEGFSQAFEVWGSYTYIEGCKFTVPHAHSSGENYAVTFTANDHSTNIIQSSVIEALGSTNAGGNIGVQVFQASWNKFDNCLIRMQGSLLPSTDCAVYFVEDFITAIFDNCTFELSPYGQGPIVPLCRVEHTPGPVGTSGKLEFNNCFYWPSTNGVIVDNANSSVIVTVRGGNLKRSNFTHPELVNWLDTIEATNASIAYVINTNGNAVMDVRQFLLNDENGQNSVIFGGGPKVLGNAGQVAVDWGNRELDDAASNPTLDWNARSLQGAWQTSSPLKVGGLTNTSLTGNELVGTDANGKEVSVILGAGVTLSGPPYTLSATGGAGGVGNLQGIATNVTLLGWTCFINPTNSNNGTNWTTFTGTNWMWQNVGTNGGSGYLTNTFFWGNGSTSNMLKFLNTVGQQTIALTTNGYLVIGTNAQFLFDTSGTLTISGSFIGTVPLSDLGTSTGPHTLANPSIGSGNYQSVATPILMDASGATVGGALVRDATVWTNSGAAAVTELHSSVTVTNILNALQINATNGMQIYGTSPGSISSTANGISNVLSFGNGSNSMSIAVGSSVNQSNVFVFTNTMNGLSIIVPAGVTITNQNWQLAGVIHSDPNGKLNTSLLSANDFASQTAGTILGNNTGSLGTPAFNSPQSFGIAMTNDQRALTLGGLVNISALTVTNAQTNLNITASRMVITDSSHALTNASASGAVPIDADGTATTTGQINGLGGSLTNALLAIPTNSFGQVLIASQECFSNMTANITVTGVSGTDSARAWSALLIVTNSGSTRTVTFPASIKGDGTNRVMAPVYQVDANSMAEFQVNGHGNLYTNVNFSPH